VPVYLNNKRISNVLSNRYEFFSVLQENFGI